ncbi:hypothetical protein ACDA63_15845, partial [Uliginosibacterium sp. sgz301328]|uniref:M30 family zinc metallopeptidase n=1 Tax=Uliginosibacterium sp. sgz301328 TaxID=3243764 RepID=UPI00359EB95F
ADCSGTNCGAASNNTYGGTGVGIWHYSNTGSAPVSLPITIYNVPSSASVTLIYTNDKATSVAFPAVSLGTSKSVVAKVASATDTADSSRANTIPSIVRDFDARSRMRSAATASNTGRAKTLAVAATPKYTVGQSRNWYISQNDNSITTRTATLRRKATASDGRVINIWVEDSEYGSGRFTSAHVDQFAQRFAIDSQSVYSMVVGLIGEPWGSHSYPNDLIPADQELDIVFVNFDRNSKPYGMIGYFWSNNNFYIDPSVQYGQYSNESLSFYMDTETVYLASGDDGVKIQLSTLAHEFTHMINFYQRGVLMSSPASNAYYDFETFLEEGSALMTEDIVGLNIDPTYNALRDDSFADWIYSSRYNCGYIDWNGTPNTSCFSYAVSASFGGYLLRQYGVDFYKSLLRDKSSTDSVVLLDGAIRKAGGPGFAEALRRWSTMGTLLPATGAPSGYGMPARSEYGFTLPAINGPAYAAYVTYPSSLPTTLQPYAQFPLRRSAVSGAYTETVPVPAGVSVTVVVK